MKLRVRSAARATAKRLGAALDNLGDWYFEMGRYDDGGVSSQKPSWRHRACPGQRSMLERKRPHRVAA